ncbi:LADA_0G07382g1_1 [Lachancea dasiensis]|uniref:LADA_0G07382g1_1 n=1 Tax=Lachancea dasiensis TaxID=1072105 RepID=A0A1G4JTL1_9SACH|nr:LADA_0G07382g1_1 [Lachancea dasiensis]
MPGTKSTRKRFRLAEGPAPLQSKSVNAGDAVGPLIKKRRRATTPPHNVFENEHVGIRLVDAEPWQSRERSPRRLRFTTAVVLPLHDNLLDADRSIQLDDFDEPPNSTSTPRPSPRPGSGAGNDSSRDFVDWHHLGHSHGILVASPASQTQQMALNNKCAGSPADMPNA